MSSTSTITSGISAILLAILFVFFLWTGIRDDSVSRIGWAVLCLFFYVNVNDNFLKSRLTK